MLDECLILAPERYTGREAAGRDSSGVSLSEFVLIRKESITPKTANGGRILVADTGNADEGILKLDGRNSGPVRSTKRLFHSGDVIVSRLRPYLRQVALVDADLFDEGTVVAGSTEFYVLRSQSEESIAFLVPWLLSEGVQSTLAASLEGAHHPRFNVATLLQLKVPRRVAELRSTISAEVESSIQRYRSARSGLDAMLRMIEDVTN